MTITNVSVAADGRAEDDENSPFLSIIAREQEETSRARARQPRPGSSRSGGRKEENEAQKQRKDDYLVGILLLLLVVLLWTGSNFLTNTVLTHGYHKPFAVTYFNTSSFFLYLIPFCFLKATSKNNAKRQERRADDIEEQNVMRWWEKLGFRLPEGYQISLNPTEHGGYLSIPSTNGNVEDDACAPAVTHCHRTEGAAGTGFGPHAATETLLRGRLLCNSSSVDILRSATFAPRPSSIDGRRPASILSVSGGAAAGSHTSRRPSQDRAGSNAGSDTFPDQLALAASSGDAAVPVSPRLPPLTLRQTSFLSLQFTLVWFLANYSLNAGLGLTSVASGTTLSSASGFFTLALGTLFAVERFTWTKLVAVAISFTGVAMVTWADAGLIDRIEIGNDATLLGTLAAPINVIAGDLLSLASAFFYAIYVTLLKLKIGSEDRVSMPLFFGFVGLFNITLLWPFGLLLHLTKLEPFAWPSDWLTWAGVATNMAITFTSDFAYLLAMLKSSPLIATVGLSLTIPLAVIGDVLRGSHSGGTQAIIGSAMVLLSFVAIGLADNALIDSQDNDTFSSELSLQGEEDD
ncbi:hypothetical protein K437DRAFT_292990 [Tilletiaria anomala UBC 951]|uniref:DUF3955 domain-containing protein n=1 Tax=Tilletiaria anomala (strain ATCC 24038 / CBS 436.72 / UBC 951) TaxID=1037660 RepID=A0A066WPJ2_TILAU|nr:uncharacterized protein K437DRAFT_292990 [Tilletiaria anomala UBC 951]KDN52545.1 hypothetical protein K437DRAFT_292990 [Tilletiaria anomala UBC 951]